MTTKSAGLSWDELLTDFSGLGPCPSISIILPTYRSAHRLPASLDALLAQKYPNFEVIIIDATSEDRTLQDIQYYNFQSLKVYSVVEYDFYAMLNRGIAVAKGKYINFLRPGDFYLSVHTLLHIARMAIEQGNPDIVYCGSLIHNQGQEPKVLMRDFQTAMLKRGKMPTNLQSCWFRHDTLQKEGGFNAKYQILADLDLLCSISKKDSFKVAFTPRVLVDDERRRNHYRVPFRWMQESFRIILRHFGLFRALRWFLSLKPRELFSHLWHSIKKSLFIGH